MRFIRHMAMTAVLGGIFSVGAISCTPERPDVVPSSAQLMQSGNGMVHYMVPDDGKVYVYDHAAMRLIWSGRVVKGQAVDLDSQKNQIMVGGSVVSQKSLVGTNINDIYFEPSPMPAAQYQNQNNPYNSRSNYNNGLTVTPSVSVQPNNGQSPAGSVTVQPGLNVAPSTQPAAQ